jgi:hypothetical protein
MRRVRATEVGKIAKRHQNASESALQSVRRYNASEAGQTRTTRQAALRKQGREVARAQVSQNPEAEATIDSRSGEVAQDMEGNSVNSDEPRDISHDAEQSESDTVAAPLVLPLLGV